ncbi:MAG: hypothetical protein Q9167_006180 [Letrouitia subvulpina]
MVAPRRKNFAMSRRRAVDEGEDDEGSVVPESEGDSLSEGSAISDADEDADAEGSDLSDSEAQHASPSKSKLATNGQIEASREQEQPQPQPQRVATKASSFAATTNDTAIMMNGLKISGDVEEAEEVHFDDMAEGVRSQVGEAARHQNQAIRGTSTTQGDKRRLEHEEYKKKRDTDPSFVPNRGGFFMHDYRSATQGQNGFRPFGRGRGKGRAPFGGSVAAAEQVTQPAGPTDAPWAHDLHETVVQQEEHFAQEVIRQKPSDQSDAPMPLIIRSQMPNRSFSRTARIGNVQIRVYLSGMLKPITFSAVPVNQHTRLPHHRPPLRRDKPVRISLPNMPIRYIFPSTERSFIFIPRALRPNQQGFGRTRARGSFSRGFGPLSSRRTSAYAGSAYSPSVALSRRSSLAHEVSAEGVASPARPTITRPHNIMVDPSKPVVRLPPPSQQEQEKKDSGLENPEAGLVVNIPPVPGYPLPEKPTYRENRPTPLPMYQPKPQKAVSVTDIESPATLAFNPPQQQDQQPFHQQVPVQVAGQTYQQDSSLYPHSRHPSHPSQASGGTPLSQIPERAIHAQPFQPYTYAPPPAFYPQQFAPTLYYYPSTDQLQVSGPSIAASAFVPGQQYSYPTAVAPPPAVSSTEATAQAGTVAHESNGMVYYYDSSQLNAGGEGNPPFVPASYSMPPSSGVVGMGGMITPPMQYFPQPSPAVYYPPQ